jgi:hypothetical protein
MDKSKKSSVTYNEALGKIPQQLEKAFGFKVPEDWLNSKENLKLVKDWAAGSEAAGEKIRNSLSNNLEGAMKSASKVFGQESQEMINWLNTFSGAEVWITASMDNQGVMTSVTESMQAA